MTLQDLGNLGEFVGAVGVVVSFVFLAVQIRHNTRALRDAAEKDMAQDTANWLGLIVEHDDVARIFRLGLRGWEGLDEDERVRFSMIMFGAFFHYQHLWSRHRLGQLDPEYWAGQWQVIMWYCRQPGFRSWWTRASPRLNKSFVHFIEAEALQTGAAAGQQATVEQVAPGS